MRPPDSPIADFKLERYFARWEFVSRHLLSSSDVEGWAMSEVLALADAESRRLWDELTLGYTESPGHPLLRAEIASLYASATPADVLCTVSAEEAIYLGMRLLLKPGDHVVALFPNYQSSYEIARSIGAEISWWRLEPSADRWAVDLDALRALVRADTRLICVNFPSNPTGALPTHDEWRAIVEIARERACYLFSDEVYRWMEYSPGDRLTAAVDAYDRGISLGAMSKGFGLAGLRVGWMATRDRELLARALAYKDYTTICGSAPSEILALIALRARERVLQRCMTIVRDNLDAADAFMAEHGAHFSWIRPRAGSVGLVRWHGETPIDALAASLASDMGTMILPGSVFDLEGNVFRLGLGRSNLVAGLDRLLACAVALR